MTHGIITQTIQNIQGFFEKILNHIENFLNQRKKAEAENIQCFPPQLLT